VPALPHLPRADEPPQLALEPGVTVLFSPEAPGGYAAIVSLHGEHDLSTSPDLKAALAPILGDVLVDLTRCEFIDSTVIGIVLAKHGDLKREGRRIDLVVPPANARITRVVDVVGMRDLLAVLDQLPA
jgi:anti-anti-sigma factor